MRKIGYLLFIMFITPVLSSCHKAESVSDVPHIDFINFTIFDTTDILGNASKGGRLRFHFEDGDGNVGLDAPSETTTQQDTTNLFFTLYRKVDGAMVAAADNDLLKPSSYRIPYMESKGQDKIMKGTIAVTFLYLFYAPGDTIKYDFYIKDRSENVSNVASTSEIALSVNNTYK
jgi:hypothetical protein